MSNNFLAQNLKFLRGRLGLSQLALAKKINCQSSTINRMEDENVQSKPRERTLLALSTLFNIAPETLLNTEIKEYPLKDDPSKNGGYIGEPIPLLNLSNELTVWSMFGDPDDAITNADPRDPIDSALSPKAWLPNLPLNDSVGKNLAAFIIRSEALAPTLRSGDVVYVDNFFCNEKRDTKKPKSGDLVLATVDKQNEELPVFRKLLIDDNGKYWLVATNPDWPKDDKTLPCNLILGIVVGLYRKI